MVSGMRIRYSDRKDAKDLNSVRAVSYKPKLFSAKHPLLAKILATCFMLEGVCMPFGSVKAAPKEAGAVEKSQAELQKTSLKNFISVVERIEKTEPGRNLGFVDKNSKNGRDITKQLLKLDFYMNICTGRRVGLQIR